MYHSNSDGNFHQQYRHHHHPVSYTSSSPDQATPNYINNTSSKQAEDLPSSLFYFPSPYIPYENDLDFWYSTLVAQGSSSPEATTANIANMAADFNDHIDDIQEECNKHCDQSATTHEIIPRRRTSKNDRHSKIETAQGPRDRRMRLSLDVARKFFGLQDMLGFDKASKTVEWLLIKSKTAIQEVTRGFPVPGHIKQSCSTVSASSTSECEVLSGIDECPTDRNRQVRSGTAKGKREKKAKGSARKSAFHPLARESREKARERARERTKEKRMFGEAKLPLDEEIRHADMNRLGSWSPFRNGKESGAEISQNIISPNLELLADVPQELSSSMAFFTIFSQENNDQFTDYQVYGKQWEAYNNMNLG